MVSLLKLTGQSKKLIVTVAGSALSAILSRSSYQVRLLDRVCEVIGEKTITAREKAVDCIIILLEKALSTEAIKTLFIKGNGLECLERTLRKSLSDANGNVREKSRQVFSMMKTSWPDRADM